MRNPINRRNFLKYASISIASLPFMGDWADKRSQQNWTDSNYIGFWQPEPAKKMQFAIINNGILSEKIDIEGNTHAKHSYYQANISKLPRDKVESMRFYSDGVDKNFYPDDIMRFRSDLNEMKAAW